MRIGFYNPYLDSLSGGERYMLTLASHWSKTHDVYLFWDDKPVVKEASNRLNLDLSNVKVIQNIFRSTNSIWKSIQTSKYDLLFVLTDGSIPTTFAKHNILHFQVPFSNIITPSLKLGQYDAIVCNSTFTKEHLDVRIRNKAVVIYPPVAVNHGSLREKKKIILTVGRFSGYHRVKKQDILIKSFIMGYDKKFFEGWKMVCIGGLLESDYNYFADLKKVSQAYPIELIANGSFEELKRLYIRASLYWHGAGYGEIEPALMEHFGISTVEAMSYGSIPVVYNGGGQPEIVHDGINGYLWNTTQQLIDKTVEIQNDKKVEQLRRKAMSDAKQFDVSHFTARFDSLLYNICR